MGIKVAATCLNWSQSVVPHSLYNSHPSMSLIYSPSSKKQNWNNRVLVCQFVNQPNRLSLFRMTLFRSHSSDNVKSRDKTLKRACNPSLDRFSDEEFSKEIQELALSFQLSCDDYHNNLTNEDSKFKEEFLKNKMDSTEPPWLKICPDLPIWPERDRFIHASIERKANKVDLPLSLRIIKKKKQLEKGFRVVGESTYCSMKKAFSSMVFIIREIHSYTLQMREVLFFQDLQSILSRVEREIEASFVWLFQQVFSHTPSLMVYVMILLANFTVHSMSHNIAIAASPPPPPLSSHISTNSHSQNHKWSKNSLVSKTSFVSFNIGGNNGRGGKVRPIANGADSGGDGWFDGSLSLSTNHHHTFLADEISQLSSFGNRTSKETILGSEEVKLWDSIMEEASRMQTLLKDEVLDHETMKRFVSPVRVEIEPENYVDYMRTDLMYQLAVSQEPQNCLLLSNYAQFIYLVFHDHDRAELYFNKAIQVEPLDAEILSRYASFLWVAKKDIGAAEQTYLEAMAADPGNTFHAANYANFLWNTGGDDTCYTLETTTNNSTNEV